MGKYIHGYHEEEQRRLYEQAGMLTSLIYPWIDLNRAKTLLEIGSGVGGQTQILLETYPHLDITCVDISESQLIQAQKNLSQYPNRKIDFIHQDVQKLDLGQRFDAVFVCWVLEHLSEPLQVLKRTYQHLKPGGIIYLTEVFNSSFHFYPNLPGLRAYYEAFNDYQQSNGGNPDIGLQLGNLLLQAGFEKIKTQPGGFHIDQSQPERLREMTAYWKKLMVSAADEMINNQVIKVDLVEEMKLDLDRIASDPDAVFFYQFIQAQAYKSL